MFRIIEFIVEGLGWLLIMASPLLGGLSLALLVYLNEPNQTTLLFGIVLSLAGLAGGIILANRIRKEQGSWHFLSRLMHSGKVKEMDKKE